VVLKIVTSWLQKQRNICGETNGKERVVEGQAQQAEDVNRKDLVAEDTSAESGTGGTKHRERFAGWLGDSPGVQILSFASQAAAVVSIIVAGITYVTEAPERTKEKNYQAWQAINTAQGQRGSGGRIEALQDLNNGNQSLVGLSVENAFLPGIDLENAELDNANFQEATLSGAKLQEASLRGADLRGANFGDSASDDTSNANLEEANLKNVDARGAVLTKVNFQGANFKNADLSYAVLDGAQLQGVNLKGTSLEQANLTGADLQRVDFQNSYLYYADISGADLRGAKHLTQEQINASLGDDETQLPADLHPSSTWVSGGPLSESGPLSPGTYSTPIFDAPMSFTVDEGWRLRGYETDTYIELDLQENTAYGILFVAPKRVYDPRDLGSAKILPRPKDMVTWLRDHPYLNPVNEPVDVVVGGVVGKQFDVQIPAMPQDYPSEECETPCLPLFVDDPGGGALRVYQGGYRIIVLDIQDQAVVIMIDLEEGTPAKAEEVLKTIDWKGV
jgi:uncharacterized protein YjbI with pentapeptide repeats